MGMGSIVRGVIFAFVGLLAAHASASERYLRVSTREAPLGIDGAGLETVSGDVHDYAISVVGPGEDAKRTWAAAKANGLPTTAKVQANCSWEIAAFPYLPVMDLVAEHAHNLVREGVDGVVLSWSHGCCPAPNLSVFRDVRKADADKGAVLDRLAAGLYGREAVGAVRKAWTAFADGYRAFPFSVSVAYSGPQHMGPANPLYLEPTGYAATMVGLPYDSVKRWCAQYPAETWVRLMSAVRDGFERGCAAFAEAIALMPEAKRAAAERELAMFRAETLHFRSCAPATRRTWTRCGRLPRRSSGRPRRCCRSFAPTAASATSRPTSISTFRRTSGKRS